MSEPGRVPSAVSLHICSLCKNSIARKWSLQPKSTEVHIRSVYWTGVGLELKWLV
jgi:hypothetical protein